MSRKSNIAPLIDELGQIKAKMAELELREKAIKAILIEGGQTAYEGDLFRATISHSVRDTLDMEAVRVRLSSQFIRAHTNHTPVVTLRVVARTADDIAA